ncbi:MAG: acetyl-CoA C-acetyltransferase [Gemmatimonadota bacterium]
MPDAFILDAARTPRGRGKPDGSLHEVSPVELAATPLRAIAARNHLDTAQLDDVVLGCVEPAKDQSSVIARFAVLAAGYDQRVPGTQLNRFCGSGLEACNLVAAKIMAGMADLAIGGGVESMSRLPMGSSGATPYVDPELAQPLRAVPQGISADLIATKYGYSRRTLDEYSVQSQRRAKAAWDSCHFKRAIVPVVDRNGLTVLDRDEIMRPDTTVEALGSLAPAFEKMGAMAGYDRVVIQAYPEIERLQYFHHAGNSSGIVDGAAAVLFGSAEGAKRAGLKPRARVRSFSAVGSEPTIMLTGPAESARIALKRAGMSPGDIDLYEINEAFAVVALYFMDNLGVPHEKTNVNGGAIAMGHPLGATGAIILGTAVDELERRGASTALVTLCVGGGMAVATVIERV